MVNTQTSWLRRRRVIENYVDVLPETTEQVDDASDAHAPVMLALGQLPPGMRAIVVLRFYEDLGEAETARVLGCSIGTVKSQTSRGLARMRVHLTEATPSSAARREEP
jgi:RNA polymerase sigma factor (sigma-70 family)